MHVQHSASSRKIYPHEAQGSNQGSELKQKSAPKVAVVQRSSTIPPQNWEGTADKYLKSESESKSCNYGRTPYRRWNGCEESRADEESLQVPSNCLISAARADIIAPIAPTIHPVRRAARVSLVASPIQSSPMRYPHMEGQKKLLSSSLSLYRVHSRTLHVRVMPDCQR